MDYLNIVECVGFSFLLTINNYISDFFAGIKFKIPLTDSISVSYFDMLSF